jgi:predicted glycosyltransferase involved in capsule biosynthesis
VESAFRWKGIRSCNFGVWRRDFEAVNGFDETFSGWGHEDADLVLRLHHHGLMRKNAAWGTEVFHLAHPQASRAREGENRDRVLQRMQGRQVRADVGYAQAQGATENTVVTELN